jgi:hypothetical protein
MGTYSTGWPSTGYASQVPSEMGAEDSDDGLDAQTAYDSHSHQYVTPAEVSSVSRPRSRPTNVVLACLLHHSCVRTCKGGACCLSPSCPVCPSGDAFRTERLATR